MMLECIFQGQNTTPCTLFLDKIYRSILFDFWYYVDKISDFHMYCILSFSRVTSIATSLYILKDNIWYVFVGLNFNKRWQWKDCTTLLCRQSGNPVCWNVTGQRAQLTGGQGLPGIYPSTHVSDKWQCALVKASAQERCWHPESR